MFDCKKTSLYETPKASAQPDTLVKSANVFERELYMKHHETLSGNGALKYDTTGSKILDDFGTLAKYKEPRDINDIFQTMEELYSENPLLALKETVFLRLITRDTRYMSDVFKGCKGQGLRYEFIGRMMWLATHHKATFEKNLMLFISAGSWQDIFDLLELDLSYIHNGHNRVLDWKWITAFIGNYLQDEEECNLIKKYLPQIKNAKRCTTLHSQCTNYIAKYIATYLFPNEDKSKSYAQYRRLKASGTAHEFQKVISRQDYAHLNFNSIPGRALMKLSNSRFLENHDLEHKYEEWILSKPVAPFKGYCFELFANCTEGMKNYQKITINKQFEGLIQEAKSNTAIPCKFICCIDSSGSMTSRAQGTNCSSLDVAKSLGLYFSELLEGPFKDTFMEFESNVHLHQWSTYEERDWRGRPRGTTYTADNPVDKFLNPLSGYCGSTNPLSCATCFVELLGKYKDETLFPNGVILISDGEFNNCGNITTFEQFLNILRDGGFSDEFIDNFKIVLWDIPNSYYGEHTAKFESLGDRGNFFYLSGFDGSSIQFLFGVEQKDKPVFIPKTPGELMEAALSQDILQQIQL